MKKWIEVGTNIDRCWQYQGEHAYAQVSKGSCDLPSAHLLGISYFWHVARIGDSKALATGTVYFTKYKYMKIDLKLAKRLALAAFKVFEEREEDRENE